MKMKRKRLGDEMRKQKIRNKRKMKQKRDRKREEKKIIYLNE